MESAHAFAYDQLQKAGMKQKRNYDLRARGGGTSRLGTWCGRIVQGERRAGALTWTVTGWAPVRYWRNWVRWCIG